MAAHEQHGDIFHLGVYRRRLLGRIPENWRDFNFRVNYPFNDLRSSECTESLESAAQRHAACYILIVWAGADTPSAPPWRNPTPSPGHWGGGGLRQGGGGAFSQIAAAQRFAICLFLLLLLRMHLMKTDELSPLPLPRR